MIFFIHCYLETLQHLWSYRVYGLWVSTRRRCISIVVLSMFHLLNSLILILWYMNLINNGQMDRGNENPIQHLPWWLRKTRKKSQSGWSAPGFEPGTSRMRVLCVTMEPPRSVTNTFTPLVLTKKNCFRCFALPSYERGLTTKIISLLHSFIILV